MRGFFILILICLLFAQLPADAVLRKKNLETPQACSEQKFQKQLDKITALRHKVDADLALKNYKEGILAQEKILKIRGPDVEDEKLLAQMYSKINNPQKSLAIIEKLLEQNPKDQELQKLALSYSLEQKNWDKAIVYNELLFETEPDSEFLLKNTGDLYSIKQEYPQAIIAYEKLCAKYPSPEYDFELGNLYMANQNFDKAQTIFEPLYQADQTNTKIIYSYLNSVLAQEKVRESYILIKKHHLEYTKVGYTVAGDVAMAEKNYSLASKNYRLAADLDPQNAELQNKLAESYRMLGYIEGPTRIFNSVLSNDPKNINARLGLGELEVEKKNYGEARNIFNSILKENPNYKPAKIAIAHSYIASGERLSALSLLDELPQDDEVKLIKAQVFYDINMWSDSKDTIRNTQGKDAEALKYKIKRNGAVTLVPTYSFLVQQLADEFNLDYNKYGMRLTQNTEGNKNVFLDYNIFIYSSGGPYYLTNVTNEIRGGIQARPTKKWEYRADLGVKAFQFGGAMLNTDSWIKHYFSDKFNMKAGFRRNNVEQSYVSAVGEYIDGILTGRVADNRIYAEFERKLPNEFYGFGRGTYGILTGQNLPTNQYLEGLLGVGRLVYNNPRNEWIQKIGVDLTTYNSGYQYNLLNLRSSTGVLYGNYFSPGFFTANTLNIKLEGEIKKWHLKYGATAFGGIQLSEKPNHTNLTWGFGPYAGYDINDHVAINMSYNYYNFADVQRHYFMVNAVIRGYNNHVKH